MCLRLGRWNSVQDMLADLSPDEYGHWQRAYEENPWGEARQDQRTAAGVLWMAAAMSGGNCDDLPDLMFPYFKSQDEKDEEILSRARALKQRAKELAEARK